MGAALWWSGATAATHEPAHSLVVQERIPDIQFYDSKERPYPAHQRPLLRKAWGGSNLEGGVLPMGMYVGWDGCRTSLPSVVHQTGMRFDFISHN